MKKTILLGIAATLAIGAAAIAQPVTVSLSQGMNLVSAPVVPFDPAPASVFKTDAGAPISIVNKLYKIGTTGNVPYPALATQQAAWGGILIGDGYWLNSAASTVWQFDGAPDGLSQDGTTATMTDMWISLPTVGFAAIGHPFNHAVSCAKCSFTNGSETVLWADAITKGWVAAYAYGYGSTGYVNVGPPRIGVKVNQFDPGKAYLLNVKVANLAMIIPAQ
jgi:hypothetical protein